MDATHFDRLAITVSRRTTRRAVLGLLAPLGLLRPGSAAAADPVCLENGKRCSRLRGTCCSGFCKRKRGTNKKFCRQAPNQSLCTVSFDRCDFQALTCSKTGSTCVCYVTAEGRSFCGQDGCTQQNCTSDEQCGPNAICIPAGTGCCGGGTGCVIACLDPA